MDTVIAAPGEFSEDIIVLGDTIAALNSTQALQVRVYLEEKYGIEASSGSAINQPDTNDTVVEVVEEQTIFDIILKGISDPTKKISVIKIVRQTTGLGLAESKAAVENVPKTLKEALSKAEAEKLKQELEAVGAIVEMK